MVLIATGWCSIHLASFKSLQSVTGSLDTYPPEVRLPISFYRAWFFSQIKKSIQRSYLAQTYFKGRQKFTNGRKKERKDLKNSLGICRVREMSCPIVKLWWKNSVRKVTEEQCRPAVKCWEFSKGMRTSTQGELRFSTYFHCWELPPPRCNVNTPQNMETTTTMSN